MCEHRSDEYETLMKWKNIAETSVKELEQLKDDVSVYRSHNALFEKAIGKWGRRSQVDMTIEECAELILSLHKATKRVFDPADTGARINDVCEELADVQLMINQMKLIFGAKEVKDWYAVKVERLQGLLDR